MLDYDNGHVTLPENLQGWSFIILTNAEDISSVSSANTVAGPAEINVPFDAFQPNSGLVTPSATTSGGEQETKPGSSGAGNSTTMPGGIAGEQRPSSGGSSTMPGSTGSANNTTMPGETPDGQGASSGGNSTMPNSAGSGNSTTTPGETAGEGSGGSSSTPICRANQCNTSSDCGRSNNPFSSRRCTQGTRINGIQCGRICVGI